MCLAGILAVGTVHAHHNSAAVFSTDDIEIEGVVTEFNFKNPHLNIILVVTDENGVETEWMATGPGPTPFRRWGWTLDTVQQATSIRPLWISQHDDRLVFEYEEFAARRVIHLDGRGPGSEEHTLFGHPLARYEGDALIIETTRLLGNLSGPLGNALSDRASSSRQSKIGSGRTDGANRGRRR